MRLFLIDRPQGNSAVKEPSPEKYSVAKLLSYSSYDAIYSNPSQKVKGFFVTCLLETLSFLLEMTHMVFSLMEHCFKLFLGRVGTTLFPGTTRISAIVFRSDLEDSYRSHLENSKLSFEKCPFFEDRSVLVFVPERRKRNTRRCKKSVMERIKPTLHYYLQTSQLDQCYYPTGTTRIQVTHLYSSPPDDLTLHCPSVDFNDPDHSFDKTSSLGYMDSSFPVGNNFDGMNALYSGWYTSALDEFFLYLRVPKIFPRTTTDIAFDRSTFSIKSGDGVSTNIPSQIGGGPTNSPSRSSIVDIRQKVRLIPTAKDFYDISVNGSNLLYLFRAEEHDPSGYFCRYDSNLKDDSRAPQKTIDKRVTDINSYYQIQEFDKIPTDSIPVTSPCGKLALPNRKIKDKFSLFSLLSEHILCKEKIKDCLPKRNMPRYGKMKSVEIISPAAAFALATCLLILDAAILHNIVDKISLVPLFIGLLISILVLSRLCSHPFLLVNNDNQSLDYEKFGLRVENSYGKSSWAPNYCLTVPELVKHFMVRNYHLNGN